MIATLRGILAHKQSGLVVIDVQGVGYEVLVSGRTCDRLPAAGEEIFLHIQTNVREDAITLYGFADQEEKELFLLLNTVSGIGPKLALAILSGMGARELCRAINGKDMARLTALSGVGKKTAQRLCMELGEKVVALAAPVSGPVAAGPAEAHTAEGAAMEDAASALINLGYPQAMAWQALRSVQQRDPEAAAAMEVAELIREALRALA
ncbi:MAG TPA: Holliday junction branch migration protein RuvA [Desulfobulbus sp.]|nr:Holliday junction branch migration protein RuvA [Desulfobulbus sp.]